MPHLCARGSLYGPVSVIGVRVSSLYRSCRSDWTDESMIRHALGVSNPLPSLKTKQQHCSQLRYVSYLFHCLFLVCVFKSMLLSYNNGSFDFDMTFVFNQAKFEWLAKQSFALHCGQCSFKDWCSYAVSQRLFVALLKFSIDFVFFC